MHNCQRKFNILAMRKQASVLPLVLLIIVLAGGTFVVYNRKSLTNKYDQVRKFGARALFSDPEANQVATDDGSNQPQATATPEVQATPNLPSITTITPLPTQIPQPTPEEIQANGLPVSGPGEDIAIALGVAGTSSGFAVYYTNAKRRFAKARRNLHIL